MNGLDSMDLFDFGILLQALANNMKVGVLAVRCEGRVKYLQLDKRRLVAVHTKRPKVSLGKVLYHHRALGKVQLKDAMRAVGTEGERALSDHLTSNRVISPAQLRRARHYQLLEETLELFYWTNVGFSFINGGTRDSLPERDLVEVGEPIEIDSLLLQCTKTIDDIAKFDEVTPSLRDVYELHVDSIEQLQQLVPDPAQREFILLVDGIRDMREVLRDMRMNRFDVLDLFYRFRNDGKIRPKNAFELLMLAENRRKEFSLEKRARIYERVNELGVDGFEVVLPLAETYEAMRQDDKAAALFVRLARRCLESGDAQGALNAAQRATKLQPGDAFLRELEIEILMRTGKKAEAGVAYEALSEIRAAAGDAAGARAATERAARLHPAAPQNWRRLATLLEDAGRPRRAAAALRRAGDALRAAGDAAGGLECYRRALALCRGAWSLRYRIVRLLHEQRDTEGLLRELGDLTRIVADDATPLPRGLRVSHLVRIEECLKLTGALHSPVATDLGRAYAHLGDVPRAVAVLHEAADARSGAGHFRAVVEALDALLDLTPDVVDARRAIAVAHRALGDTNRAAAHLRHAGALLDALEAWPEAKEVYEEMVAAEPGSAEAHAGLANSLLELGEMRSASKHFHRAALLHRGSDKVDQAIAFFHEAVEKNPTDADLLDEFCEVLLATDRRAEQLQALNALVELRMARSEPARAAIALTRILEIDPRFPGAKNILQDAARQLSRMAEESEEIEANEARAIIAEIRAAEAKALAERAEPQ
jgi:tetratricopeptide (TPR) repeat protein